MIRLATDRPASAQAEASAPTVPALPSQDPTRRRRFANNLAGVLPELGVTVAANGDGQYTITLPAAMAELFLVDLEGRAQEWAIALRKARVADQEQQATLTVERGQHAQRLEAQEDAWLAKYEEARRQGAGHLAAVHEIAGYDPTLPRRGQDCLSVQMVQEGIQHARARASRGRVEERTAEILQLVEAGLSCRDIADHLGVSEALVRFRLKEAGVKLPDRRKRPRGVLADARAQLTQGKREAGD